MRNSKGFTLIELAIVLVIIGIIIGGVIKGQAVIANAKGKRVYRDAQSYQTAYMTHVDKSGNVPGDSTTTGTTGQIESGEVTQFWKDLRTDGSIPGASDDGTAANDIYGSSISVLYNLAGLGANALCMPNVPYDIAKSIDTNYDDGKVDSGSIREASSSTSTTALTAFATTGTTNLCFSLEQ